MFDTTVYVLLILIWPLCLFLIGLVLLQGGAGDMSSAFGGGGQLDSTLGVGAGRKMSKLTGWLVFAFLAIVTILAIPHGSIAKRAATSAASNAGETISTPPAGEQKPVDKPADKPADKPVENAPAPVVVPPIAVPPVAVPPAAVVPPPVPAAPVVAVPAAPEVPAVPVVVPPADPVVIPPAAAPVPAVEAPAVPAPVPVLPKHSELQVQ